jgi:Arc/MetJ-type ribon-helix-helix transcriptional regulator
MTITVRLPQDIEARLRARLEAANQPLSDFVRAAIVEKLDREGAAKKPSAYELWKKHFDKGYSSGETDRAERAEEILREMFDAKRRGR